MSLCILQFLVILPFKMWTHSEFSFTPYRYHTFSRILRYVPTFGRQEKMILPTDSPNLQLAGTEATPYGRRIVGT